MIIKILGPSCTNCKNIERATREALDQLGIDATVQKVEDYARSCATASCPHWAWWWMTRC